ncbi:MAG: SPOR domain-containing protein [Acidobacteriota bacterium]
MTDELAPVPKDRDATTFAPSADSVLDLPAEPVFFSRARENDPVLEEVDPPVEFEQHTTEEAVVVPIDEYRAVEDDSGSLEPAETAPNGRAIGWLISAILTIGALAALIYYVKSPKPSEDVVVAVGATGTPTPLGLTLTSSPSLPATSPPVTAASPASHTPEAAGTITDTSRKPTPSPAAETRTTEERPKPDPDPGSESATRARAVNPETLNAGKYTLQVGAHPTEDEAKRVAERLIDAGLDARIIRVTPRGLDPFYRIRVGAFATKEEAAQYGEQLKRSGRIDNYYVTDRRN